MGSLQKNSQLMLDFVKAPFLHPFRAPNFSYYTLMTFLMLSVILLSMLMILLYFKCDQVSDLWQQLELTSELESDLWTGTGSGLLISMLEKFNWFRLTVLIINTGAVSMKMSGSALEEKSYIKMLGLTFSSKLDWGSCIISIAKTASKKIGALIRSIKFLSPEVPLISANLPYAHTWNTVITSLIFLRLFFLHLHA